MWRTSQVCYFRLCKILLIAPRSTLLLDDRLLRLWRTRLQESDFIAKFFKSSDIRMIGSKTSFRNADSFLIIRSSFFEVVPRVPSCAQPSLWFTPSPACSMASWYRRLWMSPRIMYALAYLISVIREIEDRQSRLRQERDGPVARLRFEVDAVLLGCPSELVSIM